jgi:FAD/FMN-containing dehydrogenase/mannose-6-phosphate isomerase-like protein (cupin superfamily)
MYSTATSLSDVMAGPIVAASDRDWDSARQAFNLAIDQRPAAVAFPVDERDVIAAVDYAREHGLRIAAQATGHGAGPLGPLDDTVLLRTSGLGDVSINAAARRVRVGAGVKWESVTPQLSALGLAALHGSSPGVGIVGYSLGGGMGWLARKHGLQTSSVTAIELVTADGHLVRADASHAPELFWALRGGGGNFGVVTAIEIAVYPVAELYAGAMFFPFERASEVLHAWSERLPAFPDELTSWASLLHLPNAPHLPQQLRDRSFTVVFGAFLGREPEGRELLEPVRRLRPEVDTFATVPPLALGELAMDPPGPVPYLSAHHLLDELPAAAIDDLLAAAGPGSGSALGKVQLRHMGGALGRRMPGAGALAALPGSLSLFSVGVVTDEESRAAVQASLENVQKALRRHRVGAYASLVEEPADASTFFEPRTWARLREVKALYDPADLFSGNHHVPPSEPETRSHVPPSLRLSGTGGPRAASARSANGGSPKPTASAGSARTPGAPRSAVARPLEEHRWSPAVALFEGRWDGIETSIYVTTFEPGEGPRLHRHPYPEVFLVQEGSARFDVDGERLEIGAGHFVVVAPETPHRYENVGAGPLTVLSVHPSGVVIQTNL